MTRIWLAEFIGTFALVFAGIAAIASGASGLAVAFAFGLSVAVMIAAVGALSFAHFNPAVTVGFFVLRRITFRELLLYWSAELAGRTVCCFCPKDGLRCGTARARDLRRDPARPRRIHPTRYRYRNHPDLFSNVRDCHLRYSKTGTSRSLHRVDRDAWRDCRRRTHGRVDEPRPQLRPCSVRGCVVAPLAVLACARCRRKRSSTCGGLPVATRSERARRQQPRLATSGRLT